MRFFFGEHLMILSNIFVINIIWGEDLMTFWYRECCQEQLIILASDRACQSLNFMLDLFLGPLLCDFNDFFLRHGFSTSFPFRCFHLSDVFHFDAFAACASHLKVHPSWMTDWMNEWMGNELGRSIKWWGKRRWTVNQEMSSVSAPISFSKLMEMVFVAWLLYPVITDIYEVYNFVFEVKIAC